MIYPPPYYSMASYKQFYLCSRIFQKLELYFSYTILQLPLPKLSDDFETASSNFFN